MICSIDTEQRIQITPLCQVAFQINYSNVCPYLARSSIRVYIISNRYGVPPKVILWLIICLFSSVNLAANSDAYRGPAAATSQEPCPVGNSPNKSIPQWNIGSHLNWGISESSRINFVQCNASLTITAGKSSIKLA